MKEQCSKFFIVLLTFILPLIGCKDDWDNLYDRPDWLPGSSYKVLQDQSGYTLFLEAIGKSKFANLVKGQGLCSVFAPDDDAMRAYLKKKNITAVAEIPQEELDLLVGSHIIQYSYRPEDLMNFRPAGDLVGTETSKGIYYKHITFGQEPVRRHVNPLSGASVTIYEREKYLPVLNTNLFKTQKVSDYSYNFSYFFPGKKWEGDNNFYAANARVKPEGNGLPTDNGYVYLVDEVIAPMRTVYNVLEDADNHYTLFKKLYDKFTDIVYDKDLSAKYAAAGDSLHLYHHVLLPKIASQWTFNKENGVSHNLYQACGDAFNAFVPNDETLTAYLNSFFSKYSTYDEIPLRQLSFLLSNHIQKRSLVLPEMIKSGRVKSTYGDLYDFDVDGAEVKEMCSNGPFYGINKVIEPAMFRSVTAPLLNNPNFSIFSEVLNAAGEILQLVNPDVKFTLFAPTDEALTAMGYQVNAGKADKLGDEKIQKWNDETSKYVDLNAAEISALAMKHIVLQSELTDFSTKKIYPSKKAFSYIMIFDNGVGCEANTAEAFVPVKLGSYFNGVTYQIDNVLGEVTDKLSTELSNNYGEFWKLMKKSGLVQLVSGEEVLTFIAGESVMAFVPDDATILAEQAVIPADSASLRNYLEYFFVSVDANKLSNYILPGVGDPGNYNTVQLSPRSTQYDKFNSKMGLYPDIEKFNLTLRNENGREIETFPGVFPTFLKDGIIFKISTIDFQSNN